MRGLLVLALIGGACGAGAAQMSRATARAAPTTFRVIERTDMRGIVPNSDTSGIGEPCAVRSGPHVLVVGNWYAARSTDGTTYHHIDPAQRFPSVNAGFCCDQVVLYDPVRGLFLWELAYSPDTLSNTVRLAVASTAEFETDTWHLIDITPQTLGVATRHWLDYPQLALTHDHLYLTVNVFEIGRDVFTTSVATRLSLDALAAGSGAAADTFTDPHFTLTPVQGATDTMYFAAQEPTSFGLRIFTWPDASPQPTARHVAIQPYAATGMRCAGPDGRDWCGRSDDRVMTGWSAGGGLGFMWNAAQDATHPFPYVRVARIDPSGSGVVEEDLARDDTALQYPAVAVNAAGHVGGVVAIGGGARYPGTAALIADDLSDPPGSFEVHDLIEGSSGPGSGDWGDFLCARPEAPAGTTWVTTAFDLQGGTGSSSVHPYIVRFGRERDLTCDDTIPCPDDGESCTDAVCTNGRCSSPPRPDAEICPLPDACTTASACTAGICTSTAPRTCVDGDPCTLDRCDPQIGCVYPPLEGYDGVLCAFAADPGAAACGGTIPRRIQAGFARANALVDAARAATPIPAQRRQLAAAEDVLTRTLERARAASGGRACRVAIVRGVSSARRRVHHLRSALRQGARRT